MKLDVLMRYKEKLDVLSRYESEFKFLEAHSSTVGATSVSMLSTLGESVTAHVKDAVLFVKDPFEPAVLDNLLKSGVDVNSTLQVIEQTPSDLDFDAREILNLDKLNELTEIVFRCTVAIKSCQGLSMPRALIDLDLIIHDVIAAAYNMFEGTDPEFTSMSGKFTANAEPIITFTRLEKQKYFTTEEQRAIQDAEDAHEQAVRDAQKRAELQDKVDAIVKRIKEAFGESFRVDQFNGSEYLEIDKAYQFWTGGKYCRELANEAVSNGEITVRTMAVFACFIDFVMHDSKTTSFRIQSIYAILNDVHDEASIPKGEIITMLRC